MSTPTPVQLRLTGTPVENPTLDSTLAEQLFAVDAAYHIDSANRSIGSTHKEEVDEQLIRLETEDGVEWVGLIDDLPELTGASDASTADRGGSSEGTVVFTMPGVIHDTNVGNRGFGRKVAAKLLQVISPRRTADAAAYTATVLGKLVDDHTCPNPGLHRVLAEGVLEPVTTKLSAQEPSLVFIHGTISSFEGGFAGIDKQTWARIRKQYGNRVYAFNHPTIASSPVANALELLKQLPKGLTVDLITHSRGGLVGDVLTRCDSRLLDQQGYSSEEIRHLQAAYDEFEDEPDVLNTIATEMEEVNALAHTKALTVRRLIRVACPAAGTTLLSKRLDHYLNASINIIKLAAGGPANPLLGILKAFLLQVIAERRNPTSFPGLFAMVPESAFTSLNNSPQLDLPSTLISVAGDSEIGGGGFRSLKVMLTNLYYWEANDFVVDTASMSRGIRQRAGNFTLHIANKQVDHFSYFRVQEHMKSIEALLLAPTITSQVLPKGDGQTFINELETTSTRGLVINKLYAPGELRPAAVSGRRPIVVLLPGIMGSNLYSHDDLQWVKLTELLKGALVDKLGVSEDGVTADSAVADFYHAFADHCTASGYDVSVFPYDWRLSVREAATLLQSRLDKLHETGQPIHLVAHSMGGLVARQYMMQHRSHWLKLRSEAGTRTVLLGTPWRGSHLITEVLTGHSSRIRQLSLADIKHSKAKIIETVGQFPGLVELLPLDDPRVSNKSAWTRLAKAAGKRIPAFPAEMQDYLNEFKTEVDAGQVLLKNEGYESIYYVAGHHDTTVDDYRFTHRRFFQREQVEYRSTALGDGSVTWARGIPEGFPSERLYYTQVQHTYLAADESLFAGIVDLFSTGRTRQRAFAKTPPVVTSVSRGGFAFAKTELHRSASVAALRPEEVLLGVQHVPRQKPGAKANVHVKVFNGDLKWARYPVLVGHFKHDGIVSAERAIDAYLGNVLTERHQMGFYPGAIGEQEVIVDYGRRPAGTVVVGLGDKDDLTGFGLAKTIEKGLLKYVLFNRDNHTKDTKLPGGGHGISMLFVGSNYGKLPLRESLRNLLLGVRQANAVIAALNTNSSSNPLRPIRVVELVDYYEDRAYEAYQTLHEIIDRDDLTEFIPEDAIEEGFGMRRRFLREGSRSWWQTVTTTTDAIPVNDQQELLAPQETLTAEELRKRQQKVDILRFDTYDRGASVSTDAVYSNLKLARFLASAMSVESVYDPEQAKVMFEMLIPNRYKDFIRNHRNIVWRMDLKSAAFPWELFHDDTTGKEPTFVRAGMVRQLQSATSDIRPALVREHRALVIANPDLGTNSFGLADLPGAKQEGLIVAEQLTSHGYDLVERIEKKGLPTVQALFSKPYKIIHIAAHGLFEPGIGQSGIVIADGQVISPGTLRQLSAIPELVFVNCCFLGQIDEKLERFRQGRHQLAANIGTQLIELGVKAVVVAGWAVDDGAAAEFSRVFYENMLSGIYFGEAVRLARKSCYDKFPRTNTWGAYQCYGDQFYRATTNGQPNGADEDISLSQEIELELDNLISRARNVAESDVGDLESFTRRASQLIGRVDELGLSSPHILEREATFHVLMGNYAAAIDRYAKLFNNDNGEFKLHSWFNFCNLQARYLTAQALAEPPVITAAKAHAGIEAVHQLVNDQRVANQGPAILSDCGSISKRMAVTSATAEDARQHLKYSGTYYLKAARLIGINSAEAIYHICSYIILTVLRDPSTAEATIIADLTESGDAKHTKPDEFFKRWSNEEAYLAGARNSPYALLRGTNLKLTEIVWKLTTSNAYDDAKTLQQAVDELIGLHARQRVKGFNLRDLSGQVENYNIILGLCRILGLDQELPRKQIQQLERVRDFVRTGIPVALRDTSLETPLETIVDTIKDKGVPLAAVYERSFMPPAEAPADLDTLQIQTTAEEHAVQTDGQPAATHTLEAESQLLQEDPGQLLIRSVSVDLSEPVSTRGRRRPKKVRVQIPDDAVAALMHFEDDSGETYVAWVPTGNEQPTTRGVSISEDRYLEFSLDEATTRGLGRKLKRLLSRAKKAVVEFFRSTKGFVRKELLNKYELQVLHLQIDGSIAYDTVKGAKAFAEATQDAERSLLMLHGMFNTAKGTFKDLLGRDGKVEPTFAKLLHEQYGGRALAMNMPTIFRSFMHNADHLPLKSIQAKTLDIIANSRGTNVARATALKLGGAGMPARGSTILAGGPAFGTPLADADHMLSLVNKVTTLLKLAGSPLGPVVPILVSLLEQGVKKVLSGDGLTDMAPGSPTLQTLNGNWGDFDTAKALYIGSDFVPNRESSRALGRLVDAELIDKAIMDGVPNDGVIPTQGTLGLADGATYQRSDLNRYKVPKANACGHFMYYQQAQVIAKLDAYLREAARSSLV